MEIVEFIGKKFVNLTGEDIIINMFPIAMIFVFPKCTDSFVVVPDDVISIVTPEVMSSSSDSVCVYESDRIPPSLVGLDKHYGCFRNWKGDLV